MKRYELIGCIEIDQHCLQERDDGKLVYYDEAHKRFMELQAEIDWLKQEAAGLAELASVEECTCYEVQYGHQPGCPMNRTNVKKAEESWREVFTDEQIDAINAIVDARLSKEPL